MNKTFYVRDEGEQDDVTWVCLADDPGEAAEVYMERLCDGDSDHYKNTPRDVVVRDDRGVERAFSVDVDWSPTFLARERRKGIE